MILMCKDVEVYNIDDNKILNMELLPGALNPNNEYRLSFMEWFSIRYSNESNTLARLLKNRLFGNIKRSDVNIITRSFSLSDCYWIKHKDDSVKFKDISPYLNEFTNYKKSKTKMYPSEESLPTLYTQGCKSKEWLNKNIMLKKDSYMDYIGYLYCKEAQIDVNKVELNDNDGNVLIHNITNENIMLEQINQSGLINIYNWNDQDVVDKFNYDILDMYIIDSILYNIDRHLGNFGFLRCSNTGKYIGLSPLYDFDNILDTNCYNDNMIKSLNKLFTKIDNNIINNKIYKIVSNILYKEYISEYDFIVKNRCVSLLAEFNI